MKHTQHRAPQQIYLIVEFIEQHFLLLLLANKQQKG